MDELPEGRIERRIRRIRIRREGPLLEVVAAQIEVVRSSERGHRVVAEAMVAKPGKGPLLAPPVNGVVTQGRVNLVTQVLRGCPCNRQGEKQPREEQQQAPGPRAIG